MAQFNLLTNATASSDLFMKAKSLSQDVIENSGLRLMTNYADLFKIEHNNNSESMFAMQWMQGNYSQGNSRDVYKRQYLFLCHPSKLIS